MRSFWGRSVDEPGPLEQKVMGFKRPAAHGLAAYRCSLPGLAGFTGHVAQGSNPTKRAGSDPPHTGV